MDRTTWKIPVLTEQNAGIMTIMNTPRAEKPAVITRFIISGKGVIPCIMGVSSPSLFLRSCHVGGQLDLHRERS